MGHLCDWLCETTSRLFYLFCLRVVKHKALRLIKYAVGKSGVEFRREIQRHSVAVRQLFHYKGQPDPYSVVVRQLSPFVSLHHLDAIDMIFPNFNNNTQAFEHLFRAVKADPG